jgi:hypothetical protein
MSIEYMFFGRPVPPVIGIPLGAIVLLVVLALLPVTIPLHFLLRKFRRQGFFVNEDGRLRYNIGPDSFRHA